jgi:acyl dehydratase
MTATDLILDRVEFTVDGGKIGEFVRATLTADPVHTDDEAAATAGFAGRAATPTHVVVAGHYRDQQAMVAGLGLDLARVVVGSVRWSYARPLVAGDHLVGTRRVVADERRDGRLGGSMRLVTLETEYVDASAKPVVWTREVIIERGAAT